MNVHSLLLHTASHLFTKSVSCRSGKFTTGDFECMVRLKRFTLQQDGIGRFTEAIIRINKILMKYFDTFISQKSILLRYIKTWTKAEVYFIIECCR